jgi:uncharacterized membrane protein
MNKRLLRIFVTGLLAALPLAATVTIFFWGARLLYKWLGPDSLVGRGLVSLGLGVSESEALGYAIGAGVVLVLVFALGLLVEAQLQHGLQRLVESLLRRIPLVGTVYDLVLRFVELVSKRDDAGLKSMSPVWCHFGGVGGAAVLALLSTPQAVPVGDRRYLAVLVPTAPVPVGGGLIYVPEEWVTPAEVGIEGLTSIYVSMGVTSAQQLGPGRPAPATAPDNPAAR